MHSFFPPSPFPPQMLPDPVSCSSTLCFAAPVGTLLPNEAVTVKSYTAGAFVMAGGGERQLQVTQGPQAFG